MGTFTAWGFQGEINAIQWAKAAPNYGGLHGVTGVDSWAPSTVPGSVRTIRIQPGVGYCCGVQAELAGTHETQAASVASGTRWDTLVARWDWTGGGSVATAFVQGTSSMALAGSLAANPGTTFDQPIALVQWTSGQDTATQVVDLRRWASKRYTSSSLLALADLPAGSVVTVGGVDYTRVLEGGSLAWSTGSAWTTVTPPSGWEVFNGLPPGVTSGAASLRPLRYCKRQGIVYIEGEIRKTTASAPAVGMTLFTLPAGFRPTYVKSYYGGWQGGRPSEVSVNPAGNVNLAEIGTSTSYYWLSVNLSFPTDV